MHWEDVRSVGEALERVRDEAARRGPGAWLSAIGGWHSSQLAEGRPPTREELDAAAPDNPVYLQELYDRGILNSAGLRAAGLPDDTARSEEHTSELQSLMRISYAVFCLK